MNMKKILFLAMACLAALNASAQVDDGKQAILDFEEDTANVVSLNDIIKVQQQVFSKNYNRENIQQVWKRKKTFTVSNNNTTLKAKSLPIYNPATGTYEPQSHNFESDWGVSLQSGNTFRLHKKPIASTLAFGLEFSPLNISVNHYKQLPDFQYNSAIERAVANSKETKYYSPWGLEMYDISYGMHIGPSVTIAPFTALKNKGLAHIRLQAYFVVGYRASVIFRNKDKGKDINPNPDDADYNAGQGNYDVNNGNDGQYYTSTQNKAETAYTTVNNSSLITWGHGLYTQMGFRLNWKFIGISYEITKGDYKHQSVETAIYGSQKDKFSSTNSRIGLTFFW